MKGNASLSVKRSPCGSCFRLPCQERWKSAQSTFPLSSAISTITGLRFWVGRGQLLAMLCRFRENDELPCENIFGQRFPSLLMGRFISSLVSGPSVECVKNERPTLEQCSSLVMSSKTMKEKGIMTHSKWMRG